MSSPEDVIDEEGDRLIKDYLDVDKIVRARNPYKEFLKQLQLNFSEKRGINLWNKVFNKYPLLNKLFKNPIIQDRIKEEYRGALEKAERQEFLKKYEKRVEIKVKRVVIRKPLSVGRYIRRGVKISAYKRSKGHIYTNRQTRFILARKRYPLSRFAFEFNTAFSTKVSSIGLRDKRLRLLKRKE